MKLEAFGIGVISEDLNGSYTKIPVNVRCPLSIGVNYLIVDKYSGECISFDVTKTPPNVAGGDVEISISQQIIKASKGSLIIRDPAGVEATFNYFYQKINELENKLNS